MGRDVPWYRNNAAWVQDAAIDFNLYHHFADLHSRYRTIVRDADVVIIGSYVLQSAEIRKWVLASARGKRISYDIDTPITLEALSRRECDYFSYELAGAMYPAIDWPSNVSRCEHLSLPRHRDFYYSLGFTRFNAQGDEDRQLFT